MVKRKKKKLTLTTSQKISLTYPAAKECVAEAINCWDRKYGDWKNATIAEFSDEILRRLGFRSTFGKRGN